MPCLVRSPPSFRHQYGNTETYHLWDAWATVSGQDGKQVFMCYDKHSMMTFMTFIPGGLIT